MKCDVFGHLWHMGMYSFTDNNFVVTSFQISVVIQNSPVVSKQIFKFIFSLVASSALALCHMKIITLALPAKTQSHQYVVNHVHTETVCSSQLIIRPILLDNNLNKYRPSVPKESTLHVYDTAAGVH